MKFRISYENKSYYSTRSIDKKIKQNRVLVISGIGEPRGFDSALVFALAE